MGKRFAFFAAAAVAGCALVFSAGSVTAGSSGPGLGPSKGDVVPLSLSPDSTWLLVTNGFQDGLKLVNTSTGKAVVVSRDKNAGVYAGISSNGRYVCYKAFEGGGTGQVPMLFDVAARKNVALCAAAPLAGTPAVGGDVIAYTLGHELIVLNSDLTIRGTYDLGHHVNLVSVSSDGSSVAYNNIDHQIVVLDLATGASSVVTDGVGDYYGPQFSPSGDKLLASSVDGRIVAGPKGARVKQVGKGHAFGWADNNTVAFTQKAVQIGKGVVSTDVVAADAATGKSAKLTSEGGDVNTAVSGGTVLLAKTGESSVRLGHSKSAKSVVVPEQGDDSTALDAPSGDVTETQDVADTTGYKYLSKMKYMHQNNDTPDYWNGNWSCNAVAAIMGMQYYNILPKHTITCSWPTTHTSDYGWYVPEKYSFNGYSYSTYSSEDPNGTLGYGGYGFITRNNWEDTKSYMRDYIIQHAPSSAVDWSPTYAEVKAEIDGNKPLVILTSLTTAGHYPLCNGYYKSQYTLIFHDPYGNKNSGSYPSDDGRYVRYDWPGYNNGYSNLNTVHCHIFCRFTPPAAPSNLAATAKSSSQIDLSWSDNSSCEEYYDVYRSTSSGSGFTKIATLGSNTKAYSATGLSASTTYYFHVKARTTAGSSAASNEASAKTSSSVSTIVVDNSDSGFTASSNWSTGTSAADKYGSDYRYRATAAVSDAAQWSFGITSAQSYAISAWWSAGSNRSASAPYILPDGTTVKKNQQTGGGAWQALGTLSLATGTNTVKLSCWTTTGYVVIADAIKVAPQ